MNSVLRFRQRLLVSIARACLRAAGLPADSVPVLVLSDECIIRRSAQLRHEFLGLKG